MLRNNFAIHAGAGCGKTHRIVELILMCLKDENYSIDKLVAITFTTKAANELKTRVQLKLREDMEKARNTNDKLYQKLKRELENFGNAKISTIHSFCSAILKEKPLEAKIDPSFEVLESSEEYIEVLFQEWLQDALDTEKAYFQDLLFNYKIKLNVYRDSNHYDNSANFYDFLIKRLEYRELDLYNPPPLTEKPAQILKKLIQDLKSIVSDLPEGNQALKSHFTGSIQSIVADPDAVIASYESKSFINRRLGSNNEETKNAKTLWEKTWEEAFEILTYIQKYPEIKKFYEDTNRVADSFVKFYQKRLNTDGLMDFSEILIKTESLLKENKDARNFFKNKFQILFIDEFQDTDPLQAKILFYLSEELNSFSKRWDGVKLEKGKLVIVGDPKQSIYRFRRSDPEIFKTAFDATAKAPFGKNKVLKKSRRSSQNIIDWVNKYFANSMNTLQNQHHPHYDHIDALENAPIGEKVAFVEPAQIDISLQYNANEIRDIEAKLTATHISNIVKQGTYKPSEILVLFRNTGNIKNLAIYLEELEVPYEMVGISSFFAKKEIHDVFHFLKSIENPLETISIVTTLKGMFYSLTDDDLFSWKLEVQEKGRNYFEYRFIDEATNHPVAKALNELNSLHKNISTMRISKILSDTLLSKGLLASTYMGYKGKQKYQNLIKAIELLDSFGNIPYVEILDSFGKYILDKENMPEFSWTVYNDETGLGAVQISTIHGAKGLENKVVYIADATSIERKTNNYFPHQKRNQFIYSLKDFKIPDIKTLQNENIKMDNAESERLRYVAATRTKELLLINRLDKLPKIKPPKEMIFISPFFSMESDSDTIKVDIENILIKYNLVADIAKGILSPELEKEEQLIETSSSEISKELMKDNFQKINPSLYSSPANEDIQNVHIDIQIGDKGMEYHTSVIPKVTIGKIIHKLIEMNAIDPEKVLKGVLSIEDFNTEKRNILQIYTRIQSNPIFERIRKSKKVFHELPIQFTEMSGGFVNGSIDLVFEEEDGFVLVDFKIIDLKDDAHKESIRKKYQAQIELYKQGLEKIGLKVKECLLVG